MNEATGIIFSSSSLVFKKFSVFNFIPFDRTAWSEENELISLVALADLDFLNSHPDHINYFSKFKVKFLIHLKQDVEIKPSVLAKLGFPRIMLLDQASEEQIQIWLDEAMQNTQDKKLIALATELNDQYEFIKKNWTERISQHEQDLKDARLKLFNSNRRSEVLKKILFEIAFETDVLRLESTLNELLPKAIDVAWVKVTTPSQYSQLLKEISELQVCVHKFECHKYTVAFIRSHASPFKKQDLSYLQKIADGIEISLRRNETSITGQELGRNLGIAFSSFPQPLAIVDQDFNVRYASSHFKKYQTSKCYKSLFGRSSPCTNCHLGHSFQLTDADFDYVVTSQSLRRQFDDEHIFLNFYQDQIEQKRVEKRLAEKSEIEDLGLVSSSIAHELNNPIGGVKSILQLNKMTLNPDHPILPEFESMLFSVDRIEKILKNLREFAIRSDDGLKENIELQKLAESILNQLQPVLKLHRIQISKNFSDHEVFVQAQPEHLKRAIENAIQFLVQEFIRDTNTKIQKIRMIEFKILSEKKQDKIGIYLDILSNTSRPLTTESLRAIEFLNIQKILIDQGFAAELFSPREDWFGLRMDLSTQT